MRKRTASCDETPSTTTPSSLGSPCPPCSSAQAALDKHRDAESGATATEAVLVVKTQSALNTSQDVCHPSSESNSSLARATDTSAFRGRASEARSPVLTSSSSIVTRSPLSYTRQPQLEGGEWSAVTFGPAKSHHLMTTSFLEVEDSEDYPLVLGRHHSKNKEHAHGTGTAAVLHRQQRQRSLTPQTPPTASTSAASAAPAPGKVKRTVFIDGFEYSENDEDDMGNGCGEGVSRNSSEEDEPDEELFVTTANHAEPEETGLPGCAAAVAAASPAEPPGITRDTFCCSTGCNNDLTTLPERARRHPEQATAFSSAVMQAIREYDHSRDVGAPCAEASSLSSTVGKPCARHRMANDDDSNAATASAQADEASTVLSGMQLMIQQHEDLLSSGAGQRTVPSVAQEASCKSFIDQFAPLYETAIFEIIMECERRVASASPQDRSEQMQRLRGRNNADLVVSAHSFDSPVSYQASAFPSLQQQQQSKQPSATAFAPLGHTGGAASVGGGDLPSSKLSTSANGRSVSLSFSCCYASSPTGAKAHSQHYPQAQQQHGLMHVRHGVTTPTSQSASGLMPAVRSFSSLPSTSTAIASPPSFAKYVAKPLESLPPAESIQRLLCALDRQMRFQESAPLVFMAALAYLSRLATRCVVSYGSVTSANWFRMTLLSLLTASKMYNEYGSRKLNALFANIAGIPLREVNKLELDFLYLVDFDLLLEEDDVEGWVQWMEALARRHNMFTPLQSFMMGKHTRADDEASLSAVANVDGGAKQPTTAVTACLDCYGGRDGGEQRSNTNDEDTTTNLAAQSFLCDATSRPCSDLRSPSSVNLVYGDTAAAAEAVASPLSPQPLQVGWLNAAMLGFATVSDGFSGLPTTPLHSTLSSAPHRKDAEGVTRGSGGSGVGDKGPEEKRLFTIVHAAAEPKSPPTIRELSRLGSTPPSPLAPPMMPSASPVGFFKRGSNVGGGGAAVGGRAHGSKPLFASQQSRPGSCSGGSLTGSSNRRGVFSSASVPLEADIAVGWEPRKMVDRSAPSAGATAGGSQELFCLPAGNETRRAAAVACSPPPERSSAPPASVTAPTISASSMTTVAPTPAAASSSSWRGNGFNVMQRAREALNVAASLVRGQLNVMGGNSGEEEEVSNVAPGTPPQQLTRNCSRSNHSNTSSAVRKAASSAEPGVSGVVAEEVSSAATVAPLVRGSTSVPVVVPAQEQASFYASTATRAASHLTEHVAHRHHGIDVRDENDTDEGEGYGVGGHDVEGVYDDEDDYEEGEEGYWDDDGYFHYYDDDEGYYDEEGNYYAYADDTVAQAESECVGTAMGHYGSGTTAFDDDDHYYDDEAYDEDGEDGEDDNDEGAVFRPPPRTHSPPAL